MFRLQWIPVRVIDAIEREIEVIAWVGEVVRVAAEVAELQFGRGHEAQIRIAAEDIGGVLGTIPELDDLHEDACLVATMLLGYALR